MNPEDYQCDDRNGWATLYAFIDDYLKSVALKGRYTVKVFRRCVEADSYYGGMIDPRDTLQGFHLHYNMSVRGWRVSFWCAT